MKYHFFLDETGDHGLTYIDKNFPIFVLCGCLFSEQSLEQTEDKINSLKVKYFKTKDVVLHSRDIRKCEGAFQILFDLKIKENFYKDLNAILGIADYTIIACGINKEAHIKKYGTQAHDPYSLSLSFVIERMIFCLDNLSKRSPVEIGAEVRGRKEDETLLAHFNSIQDRGTYHISRERMQAKTLRFKFHSKRENVVGVQIADLVAYPLARHILNPKEPYVPFQVIEKKIYANNEGVYDGWGLKVFP